MSSGFLVRFAALPFSPQLWRESASLGSAPILLPLILWALAAALIGGIRAANAVRTGVYDFAQYYEQNADPLLLENGRFSLTGERILRIEDPDDGSLFLIDPEGTVPDEETLGGEQALVVRADRIVLRQPAETREWMASEVANLFGERVLFDGDWLRRGADRWVHPALLVGYPVIVSIGNLVVCAVYAAAVGLLLLLLRGQWLGLGYTACTSVAFATSAFTIVADLALQLLGVELPIPSYVLWPLVMTALGLVALAGTLDERTSSGDSPDTTVIRG